MKIIRILMIATFVMQSVHALGEEPPKTWRCNGVLSNVPCGERPSTQGAISRYRAPDAYERMAGRSNALTEREELSLPSVEATPSPSPTESPKGLTGSVVIVGSDVDAMLKQLRVRPEPKKK